MDIKKYLVFIFTIFFQLLFSQQVVKNIDSLLVELKKAQPDTSKVILYQKIAGHFNVTSLDSAKVFAEKGYLLAEKIGYEDGKWMNLNTLANYYERKTQYPEALELYNQALTIIKKNNNTKGFAVVLNNMGTIYIKKGEYKKALTLLFDALKAEEELNNQNGIAQAYNNIGVVYYYLKNYDKSTKYLTKALETQEKLGNYNGLINGYTNIGAIRIYQEKYKEAIVSYEKALAISTKINDKKNESIELANIGICWVNLKNYTKAEEFYQKSLQLKDSIGDFAGKSRAYINYGEAFFKQNKYDKAKEYLKKGLAIAESNNLKKEKETAFYLLSNVFSKKNDFKNSNEYLRKYIAVKDSIYNESKAKSIAEMETKYQTEKKEKEILKQRTLLAEKELQVKQRNYMIFGSLALALILGLVGYLLVNQQKLKNRQLKKENQLKVALAKIETQNKLQEQRLRISRDLHDNIGAQLTFIISSLDNLKYGFKDMGDKLSSKLTSISEFTGQTIYELRDTIWAMNKENITFEDLQARISNFVDKAKIASRGITFSFSIDSKVDKNHVFSSVAGMNLYRIIQEAVNNSIKYASPSKIEINIFKESDLLVVSISDNGKGFDISQVEMGNGLTNIKKRARDCNAELSIQSEINKGTTITIKF